MFKKAAAILLVILLMFTMPACNLLPATGRPTGSLTRYEAEFIGLFDTMSQIVGYARSEDEFEAIVQSIKDDLQIYHQYYDIFNSYPGITNLKDINDRAGQGPVEVDQQIIDLLLYSIEIYNLTGGKINIAMGSVLRIWHSYREAALSDPLSARVPAHADLIAANRHTDISNLVIDAVNKTVEIKDPAMSLDVGAIAKGYATEMAARAAEGRGVRHLLLSIGGNVRAIGYRNEQNEPWRAGIENPADSSGDYLAIVNINDMSVVTSGSYERYFVVDGQRYHHIIDADTLYPENYFLSVSVITPDSGFADALSTALFCMEFDAGLSLVESLDNTEALWCMPDGSLRESSGFDRLRTSR